MSDAKQVDMQAYYAAGGDPQQPAPRITDPSVIAKAIDAAGIPGDVDVLERIIRQCMNGEPTEVAPLPPPDLIGTQEAA